MKHARIILAVFALAAPAAFAQGPGMFPWWDSPVARDLGLTDAQNQKIRDTVNESRGRLSELRSAVDTAEAELRTELDAAQVDTRKANDAIERVVAARSDLARAVSQMSLKLRLVLTAEQWRELQRRQPRPGGPGRDSGFGRSRRGPPGPPPPDRQ